MAFNLNQTQYGATVGTSLTLSFATIFTGLTVVVVSYEAPMTVNISSGGAVWDVVGMISPLLIFYTVGSQGTTITVTGTPGGYIGAVAARFQGTTIAQIDTLTSGSGNAGHGTSANVGWETPISSDSVVVSGLHAVDAAISSQPSGFTLIGSSSANDKGVDFYTAMAIQIQTLPTIVNPFWGLIIPGDWSVSNAIFRPMQLGAGVVSALSSYSSGSTVTSGVNGQYAAVSAYSGA